MIFLLIILKRKWKNYGKKSSEEIANKVVEAVVVEKKMCMFLHIVQQDLE